MARWIDANRYERAAITLRADGNRDFAAEKAQIAAEAAAVKARDDGYYTRESQRERALERLRNDYRGVVAAERVVMECRKLLGKDR